MGLLGAPRHPEQASPRILIPVGSPAPQKPGSYICLPYPGQRPPGLPLPGRPDHVEAHPVATVQRPGDEDTPFKGILYLPVALPGDGRQ